jgi:hypothetical protein
MLEIFNPTRSFVYLQASRVSSGKFTSIPVIERRYPHLERRDELRVRLLKCLRERKTQVNTAAAADGGAKRLLCQHTLFYLSRLPSATRPPLQASRCKNHKMSGANNFQHEMSPFERFYKRSKTPLMA